jgi:hypothetical protein
MNKWLFFDSASANAVYIQDSKFPINYVHNQRGKLVNFTLVHHLSIKATVHQTELLASIAYPGFFYQKGSLMSKIEFIFLSCNPNILPKEANR